MGRRRSRHNKPIRRNKIKKASNIQVFKLVDPIGQSALFIFFVYALDSDSGLSYFLPLLVLMVWQLLSWVVNLTFRSDDQLDGERKFYIITTAVYGIFLAVFQRLFLKRLLSAALTDGFSMTDAVTIAGLLALSFWYFSICFREIRSMMKGLNDNE